MGVEVKGAGDGVVIARQVAADQPAVRRHGLGHAQRTVAGEGADFENLARAADLHQQSHELALLGRNLPARSGQLRGLLAQAL